MARKARLTGCGKLIIVLVILAPLAYIGASYYNGEDPIANIKNLFGVETVDKDETQESIPPSDEKEVEKLTDNENASDFQDRINFLEKENADLKQKVESLEQEILRLKNKIQNLEADGQ